VPVEQYNTIEAVEGPYTWPSWNTTWPGYDGCGTKYLSRAENTRTITAGSLVSYNSGYVSETRDNRHLSGKRRGYPPFHMTPHYYSRTEVKNHLLKRLNASNGLDVYEQYGKVSKIGQTCTAQPNASPPHSGPQGPVWYTVTHTHPNGTYATSAFDPQEISAAIADAQNAASIEAFTQYDILTDLAESREIPKMLKSIAKDVIFVYSAMRNRYSLRDLKRSWLLTPKLLLTNYDKTLRGIGKQWMQYRYGIMPLVHSLNDIRKLEYRSNSVSTRKTRTVSAQPTGVTLPSPSTQYKWTDFEGDVVIKATVFQYFNQVSEAWHSGLGINPMRTAWELIPMSFVADWFVNVGDYITRSTSKSFSRLGWACISQRSNYTKRTWAHFANQDITVSYANLLPIGWVGSNPATNSNRTISRPLEDQLLSEETTNNYVRWLFDVNDAQLRINPSFSSLSWRRKMDSVAMVYNQLSRIISAFKS